MLLYVSRKNYHPGDFLISIARDILAAIMEPERNKSLSFIQIWWLAIRPKTLPVSMAGVVTGTAIALMEGHFSFWPTLAALGVGVLLQIASNLANDVFDFEHGTDTDERVGPMRVTQASLLTPSQVKTGLIIVILLAIFLGLALAFHAGWPVIIIGIAAIACAILYTGGPFPLGYHGFGDLLVFIFFGLAAVTGTNFVQSRIFSPAALWMSVPIGLLVVNLLVVNNLRDIQTDKKAGKITLAVRLGEKATRINYIAWMGIAYGIIPTLAFFHVIPWITMLTWLSIPSSWKVTRIVMNSRGRDLNPALAGTSRLALFFAILFMASILLTRFIF